MASVSVQDNECVLLVDFPVNTIPGEYIIAENGNYTARYLNYVNEDKNDEIRSKNGKLIILKNDGIVLSGRFELEIELNNGAGKIAFTKGEFTIPYYK
ncbi:MAG: hypothetical protein EOP53_00670 [Sphingobacteriales bacterium]|nr:MAG: hypothetical protein EOP53_00670 [Sphingobacteriales bacterium]